MTVPSAPPPRWLVAISVAGGLLLAVLGARYLVMPESAARTFGLPGKPDGLELHYVVGLRNLWLGALAVGLTLLGQWRGLALWFAVGMLVCWADAAIAAGAGARWPALAFHIGSGAACAALAATVWRVSDGGK